jgi:hypothetical protein
VSLRVLNPREAKKPGTTFDSWRGQWLQTQGDDMTADMARKTTNAAKTGGPEMVELALQLWDEAITKAANAGRSEVSEAELPVAKWATVPLDARNAAVVKLQDHGYKVQAKKVGAVKTTIVMW